jgi:hypothetical protein
MADRCHRFLGLSALDREAAEDLTGLGHIVDRQDEPAGYLLQPRGQPDA